MSQGATEASSGAFHDGEIARSEEADQAIETDRAVDRAFASIYPDVNPAVAIGPSTTECIGLAVATGVLAFGGAMGDLIIAGAALVLVLFSVIAASMKTPRRVRNEARSRFPRQDWAEYKAKNAPWMLGCWAIIIVIVALALFFVPEDQKIIGAVAVGVIAAGLMWSCPGIAPQRKKRRRKKDAVDEGDEDYDSEEYSENSENAQELEGDTKVWDGIVDEAK